MLQTLLVVSLLTLVSSDREIIEPKTGTHFKAAETINAQSFECLGVGVRRKFVFDVYAISFCVDTSHDKIPLAKEALPYTRENAGDRVEKLAEQQGFFDALTQSSRAKLVTLHMNRNLSKSTLADAFRERLRGVLTEPQLKQVVAALPGDVSKGDVVRIYTDAAGQVLHFNVAGKESSIDSPEIASAIWHVWLGPGSVVPTLKEAIARTMIESLGQGE